MAQNYSRTFYAILAGAFLIRLLTAFFNYGFLALDDYYIISTIIPAQVAPGPECQIELADIRSPLPYLFVYGASRLALGLGLTDPLNQIRFLYLILGMVSLVTVYFGAKILEVQGKPHRVLIGAAILSFQFLMPFLSTRSLLENMSTPFLVLSLFYLVRYFKDPTWSSVVLSTSFLAISSMFRFQNGMIIPVHLFVFLRNRNWKDPAIFAATGMVMLVATGLPDLFLRNFWHESLFKYVEYNLHHSSEYGVEPFYNYIPTILAFILFPFFISRFKGFNGKEEYRFLGPVLYSVLLFVGGHSLIPHKEERFLIPVLPLILILLVPLVDYFLRTSQVKRIGSLVVTNGLLLIVGSFQISQFNSIGLVRFLHSHHEIQKLYVFTGSLHHFPISYGLRPEMKIDNAGPEFDPTSAEDDDCPFTLAIRDDLLEKGKDALTGLKLVRSFEPEPAEKLLIALNPTSNGRRRTIHLYGPADLENRKGDCEKEVPEKPSMDSPAPKNSNAEQPAIDSSDLPRKIQGSSCGLEFFGIRK